MSSPGLPSYAEAREAYFVARKPRKDSPHTLSAYRNDLGTVATIIGEHLSEDVAKIPVAALTLPVMRAAFAVYSEDRSKATIRRCWSTWHGFFDHLVTEGAVEGNPMAGVAKPSAQRRVPKALDEDSTERLLAALIDGVSAGADPWPERDLAVVFTALVTGARLQEMLDLNIESFSGDPGSRRLRVRGKGDAERSVPIEQGLEDVLNAYLASRAVRFPRHASRRPTAQSSGSGRQRHSDDRTPLDRFPRRAALFVDRKGERLQRGGLQYLVRSAYRRAGIDGERQRGALVHALRHTFATRLAENPNVTPVQLMELLGHRSLASTQHYVAATGRSLRTAAASNPTYATLAARAAQSDEAHLRG